MPLALLLLSLLLLGTWACGGSSRLLGPDAPQGVEGLVLLGPMCPVASEENPCPDEPYEARIDVLDAHGRVLGRTRSGSDGRFRVGLEPGIYTLWPESGDPLPRAGEEEVEVEEGVFTFVTIRFDTGIR